MTKKYIKILELIFKNPVVFHRPHPRSETDKGAIISVRRFLQNAGVKNYEI